MLRGAAFKTRPDTDQPKEQPVVHTGVAGGAAKCGVYRKVCPPSRAGQRHSEAHTILGGNTAKPRQLFMQNLPAWIQGPSSAVTFQLPI